MSDTPRGPYYARFDHTVTPPAPVTGWYDMSTNPDPVHVPGELDRIELTQEQWDARHLVVYGIQDGKLVPMPAPPPAKMVLARADLVRRLYTAGKLVAFLDAYGVSTTAGDAGAVFRRETWYAASAVYVDGDLLDALEKVGLSPDDLAQG